VVFGWAELRYAGPADPPAPALTLVEPLPPESAQLAQLDVDGAYSH
jgi:hypothetical protein